MTNEEQKIPKWFLGLAIFLVIWNFMGVAAFFQHILISEEALQALPQNERELYGNYPAWTKVAFALAVLGGLAGSISFLLKKKIAKPLFLFSLIGIILQMGHSLFIAKATDVYGPGAAVMPVMVTLIGIFSLWLANHFIAKNWIS